MNAPRIAAIVVSLLLIAGLGGCAASFDAQNAQRFQQAERLFTEAKSSDDFLRAAAAYQDILDHGVVSGAVLYNQGNALMKAGQRGRAIAAYRQATRYLPREPFLASNLAFALRDAAPPRKPLLEYLLFWQDWLSYPEKFLCAALAVVLTFGLGVAALWVRRRWCTVAAWAGLAVCLLAVASAAYDWQRFVAVTHGVTVRKEIVLRKGNAASYEPALTAPLDEGVEFVLVERRGDWLLVRLAGGQEGWVESSNAVVY